MQGDGGKKKKKKKQGREGTNEGSQAGRGRKGHCVDRSLSENTI